MKQYEENSSRPITTSICLTASPVFAGIGTYTKTAGSSSSPIKHTIKATYESYIDGIGRKLVRYGRFSAAASTCQAVQRISHYYNYSHIDTGRTYQ